MKKGSMRTLGEIRGAALDVTRMRDWATRLSEGVGKFRVVLSFGDQASRLRELAMKADRLAALARSRALALDALAEKEANS